MQNPSSLFATYYTIDFAWWEPLVWWVGIVGGVVLVYVWSRLLYLLLRPLSRWSEGTHGDHE